MLCSAMVLALSLTTVISQTNPSPQGIDLLTSMDPWERYEGCEDSFIIKEGGLSFARTNTEPAALLTKEDYENFDLRFEFRVHRWCESQLLIHAPRNGAFRAGLEISLGAHKGQAPTLYNTGAIFRRQGASTITVNEHMQWNTCSLHMNWPALTIRINGVEVQNIDLSKHDELRYTLRRGALGFHNLGFGLDVRNLRLTPLPDTENGKALFNGVDFTGWREVRRVAAEWDAHDGIISASAGNGYLQHETVCQDFALRLYYRTSPAANGGIFFRWLTDDSDRGNEIQLLDVSDAVMVSGSIYGIARGNDLALTPGKWSLLQLSVHGSHAITHLNGIKSAETNALTRIQPGHITLQMHKTDATIDFKDIVLVVDAPVKQ